MKTTLHYLLTILLLSLATVHARAATGDEGPFKITDVDRLSYTYNQDTSLLIIRGGGNLTITGDGSAVDCGIVFEANSAVTLKIKNLHIQTAAPLLVKSGSGGLQHKLELEGTNILEATAEPAIKNEHDLFIIRGNGSLKLLGAGGKPALTSTSMVNIIENAFVVAIGGKGATSGTTGDPAARNSLLISGVEQSDKNIKQDRSDLNGNFTLGVDAEIPEWASVNVAYGQTLTIANGVTLTNSGTILGTGTINGTLAGNPVNTIGGKDKFTIQADQNVTLNYDSGKKQLTIGGSGNLIITGQGKPVNCGIVIVPNLKINLTMKDMYLQSEIPLEGGGPEFRNLAITLQGINRLESTATDSQPGMLLTGGVDISGSGSLTSKGSDSGGAGINANGKELSIEENAFVFAIGGKGATSGITSSSNPMQMNSLFISGVQQDDGSINQDYSKLAGNLELGANAEIPDWATVTIPANQSITIKENVTLTNQGTLTLEDNSTLTNQGTLILGENATFDPAQGTFKNAGTLNIKGEKGLDIMNADSTVTVSYDNTNKRLILGGNGSVTILGKGNPVDYEIEIANNSILSLTIQDLHIKAPRPLTVGNYGSKKTSLIVQGTNILESDAADSQPGILLNGNLDISGQGSLTVKGSSSGGAGVKCTSYHLLVKDVVFQAEGGNTAPGMDCYGNLQPLTLDGNAFLIAVGGKGASDGINQSTDSLKHVNGLLISGIVINGDTISQKYAELVGNMTVSTNAELPEWAEITVGNGQTFTIADGVTFTNKGHLYNHGTISSDRVGGNPPEHFVTFESNYRNAGSSIGDYITHGSVPPDTIFTREGYTFEGWYTTREGGTKVTTITNPQTVYAYWTDNNAKPDPDPDPVPPPYVPVYYDVSLPAVEGAVTDPVAGVYSVEAWDTFRFYLTLDTAYNKSEPVVTTSRNEIIKPRTSDGAYLVKYVRSDLEIYIDGIVRNNAVANDPIRPSSPEPEIWAERSYLCIRLSEGVPGAPVYVFTPSGRLMDTFHSTPGLNRRQLPTGVYIVRIGDMVRKVMVR